MPISQCLVKVLVDYLQIKFSSTEKQISFLDVMLILRMLKCFLASLKKRSKNLTRTLPFAKSFQINNKMIL